MEGPLRAVNPSHSITASYGTNTNAGIPQREKQEGLICYSVNQR